MAGFTELHIKAYRSLGDVTLEEWVVSICSLAPTTVGKTSILEAIGRIAHEPRHRPCLEENRQKVAVSNKP